jgi:hypothetical protein
MFQREERDTINIWRDVAYTTLIGEIHARKANIVIVNPAPYSVLNPCVVYPCPIIETMLQKLANVGAETE